MTARPTSWMGHEPTDEAEPTATLVDADEFDRLTAWGAEVEIAPSMGRAYAEVNGRWYATELNAEVSA